MKDIEVGRFLIANYILVHIDKWQSKFNTLCLMVEKLYAVVAGECELDNLDALAN